MSDAIIGGLAGFWTAAIIYGVIYLATRVKCWWVERNAPWRRMSIHEWFEASAATVRSKDGHNHMDLHCVYWDPRYSATTLDRCPVCNPERKP